MLATEEELLAFLLGNQGPDPLYACVSALPQTGARCRRLADLMHESRTVDGLWALRDAVEHLPEGDKQVGRAWTLGYLGHYALDSTAHPYVYAEQDALIAAGTGLANAASEVHAVIESDIDVWMLRELRGQTVADVPTSSYLTRTERVSRVAGALVAQLSTQVYGLSVGGGDYGGAVADYELLYKVIDPRETAKLDALSRLESVARPHSYLRALAHSTTVDESCPAANLDRRPWRDAISGETRTDSFPDLYHLALEKWERLARALASGDRDGVERECAGINMNGAREG